MLRNKYFSGHHSKFYLCAHVVFVTKFRRKVLSQPILNVLYDELASKARLINVLVKEINGDVDHIHFLLEYKPTDRLSSLVGALKCFSSKRIHEGYLMPYYGRHVRTLWSSGYFVSSCGGVTIDDIKKYIDGHR
jgi:putative transposase